MTFFRYRSGIDVLSMFFFFEGKMKESNLSVKYLRVNGHEKILATVIMAFFNQCFVVQYKSGSYFRCFGVTI